MFPGAVCGSRIGFSAGKEAFSECDKRVCFLAMYFSFKSVICLCMHSSSRIIFKGLLKGIFRM